MATLTENLACLMGRDVVDRTSRKGSWSIDLRFRDLFLPGAFRPPRPGAEEQRDLDLEPEKAKIDVLVLDRTAFATRNGPPAGF